MNWQSVDTLGVMCASPVFHQNLTDVCDVLRVTNRSLPRAVLGLAAN